MTSSALIAHLLDPLVDPMLVDQDKAYEKVFNDRDDAISRDYLRSFKRGTTYALDWAGDKLMLATKDSGLRLYDVEKGEEERSWPGEWMAAQTDPNNPFVTAAVSWGGKFRVFDTRTSDKFAFDVELKRTSSAMKDFLNLAWSPDSRHIALGNRSDQVYLLNLHTPGSLRLGASRDMKIEVNQMAWGPEGETLWVTTGGNCPGSIHVFPTPSLKTEHSMTVLAHQFTALSIAADPTGRHIASGGADCLVMLWDPKHLVCTKSFGFPTQAVLSLSFNHDGSLLAWGTGGTGSTGGEKNVTIVGTDTGVLYAQEGTNAPANIVKWHPRRNVLAYSVNTAQIPDDPVSLRNARGKDLAVVHTMKLPEKG